MHVIELSAVLMWLCFLSTISLDLSNASMSPIFARVPLLLCTSLLSRYSYRTVLMFIPRPYYTPQPIGVEGGLWKLGVCSQINQHLLRNGANRGTPWEGHGHGFSEDRHQGYFRLTSPKASRPTL